MTCEGNTDDDAETQILKMASDAQCRTIYFVLQLGPSASYIFDKDCSGPFITTMDLFIDAEYDTLDNVCEHFPYEQLRVYCQSAKDYDFYAVDESKTQFRLLPTKEDLAQWLLSGTESRLYTQPHLGFELDALRIQSLLEHWENQPFSWEDMEIADVMTTTGGDCCSGDERESNDSKRNDSNESESTENRQ